jgi:L-ascorbate metabolism protein UlaG (beta-lactamase superfamily)
LDTKTIQTLAKPDTLFFVPLGNKAWFDDLGVKNVYEGDWWDEYTMSKENESFKIGTSFQN